MKHSPCQASLHKGNFTLMKNTHKFRGDAAIMKSVSPCTTRNVDAGWHPLQRGLEVAA